MANKSVPENDVIKNIKLNSSLSEDKRRQQRLAHNLTELTQGNFQILNNDEFLRGLVNYLLDHAEEKTDIKRIILISLGNAVIFQDRNIRERTLTVLSLAGEHYLQCSEKGGILLVVQSFCRWLEHEKEILPGLVVVIKRMEELTLWLLENSFWKEGANIIGLFHLIQTGDNEKSTAFRSLVSQTLDKLAVEATLEHLTDGYLLGDSRQPLFQNILLFLEDRAAVYLFSRVMQSLSRKERLALIHLLPAFGLLVLPILEKCLKNNPHWTVVRNALCILAEIGNDTCYSFIKQYFRHEDKRVQYELIGCVVKFGGSELKDRLLAGLEIVDDELKVHIIQLLVAHAPSDEAVLGGLFELVERSAAFSSRSRNRLVGAAIAALKTFPSIKSIEILRTLQFSYSKAQGSEQLQIQIEEALKFLAPKLRHRQQRFEETHETLTFDSDPQQTQKALSKLASIEENLRKLVRAGDMGGAARLLHEQALSAARAKEFFLAEKLSERMLEINPMALAEAVALGDLIEGEKASSNSCHHLGVWSELYEEMTNEEFNALYSVLRQEEYRKNDIFVRAGETDDVLYFLSSGYVSLNCLTGGNENFLKRMGPGSILGGEQFFSASVWTVTLRALSDVHLQVLDHKMFIKIAEEFPGMVEKLQKYCSKYAEVPALLKMSGDDRREYPRFSVSLFTHNVLFDPYGNKGKKSFRGELIDISRNGLAFIIKISSLNNAKLMLGRQIVSEIRGIEDEVVTECGGIVVAVKYPNAVASDFTVHVKLSKKIEDTAFSKIIALRRS
jgi:hypothetical protein